MTGKLCILKLSCVLRLHCLSDFLFLPVLVLFQTSKTLFSAFLLLCWKCFQGFQQGDEPFYFAIANRILQGDALFKDEWHLSQFSAVLRVPFVFIYKLFHGSTEGILLAMRFVYLSLHTAVGIFTYIRLKKYGYASVVAVVLYYIFELYPLCTFGYNATCIDSLVIAGILLADEEQLNKLPLIVSGIFFSFAVLSCPYVAMLYAIYSLCVLFRFFWQKKNTEKLKNTVIFTHLFTVKTFLWITVGISICAVSFMTFVVSKAGIEAILQNFPSIMFGDPEHIQSSFVQKVIDYFLAILFCCGYIYFCFFAYFLTVMAMLFDKNRNSHREIYLVITTIISIATLILMMRKNFLEMYFSSVMFPLVFMGFTAYVLCEKKPKTLFYCSYVMGIFYSFAVHFASNQLYNVIFMAMVVSDIGGIICIGALLKEIFSQPKSSQKKTIVRWICFSLCMVALGVQTTAELWIKTDYCYGDRYTQNTTFKIEKGIAKGLYTTKDTFNSYNRFYDRLSYYQNKTPDRIVITDIRTWGYLYLDQFPCGSYSSWASGIKESSYQRLKDYYALNPENKARYIYLPEESVSALGIDDIYTESAEYGYSVEKQDGIYYLEK